MVIGSIYFLFRLSIFTRFQSLSEKTYIANVEKKSALAVFRGTAFLH